MNSKYVFLGAILDRSGSMDGNKIEEAKGSFNSLINEKKKEPFKFDVFLTIFDDQIDFLYEGDIKDCPKLTTENFFARNMTSLYDALGMTINKIGEILSKKPEEERPAKVMITVITDGVENKSKEINRETLAAMIKKQQEKYGWEFMFIGSDQNSIMDAQKLGIKNTLAYENNARGVKGAFESYTEGISRMTKRL